MTKRILSILLSAVIVLGLITPVRARGASRPEAGIVSTQGSGLNVRSAASTGSSILTRLTNGSFVTLRTRAGDWWQVEYARGRYGYCHADYIRSVSVQGATVVTNGGNLNVRSGAGTSYAVTGKLPNGASVTVLSAANGWSRILYHGTKTGYVSSRYLSADNTGSAVSLAVPSFKQTDNRWANVLIGSSGKTMAKIGCATTAIAMMESYRTGTTIYPDVMARKLRYTDSGNVYWPGHYTVVTDSSDYLSRIHTLLRSGKPVLFGARNNSGGQHWVVITGYTGSSLSPAGFTILDPGSSSRTTLQQFLAAYPNFYKYFHY